MAGTTGIEWCDATFSPWWGCERVSPGCAHCYADTLATRYGFGETWGDGHGFRFFGDKHWSDPLKWARTLPDKLGRRPRIFCASMADVFEERVELEEPRRRLFFLIEETPELDWLVLTKRPDVARDVYFAGGWTLTENLWLGTSIENARFTWRADVLREIPAAVRFISAEPLLGGLFPERGGDNGLLCAETSGHSVPPRNRATPRSGKRPLDLNGIDWVIIGGESGAKARPFHLDHARELIAACRTFRSEWYGGCVYGHSAPSVFVKQLGAKPVSLKLRDRKGGDMDEWPADLRMREFPRSRVRTEAGVA